MTIHCDSCGCIECQCEDQRDVDEIVSMKSALQIIRERLDHLIFDVNCLTHDHQVRIAELRLLIAEIEFEARKDNAD
jgi:hypothetical protein